MRLRWADLHNHANIHLAMLECMKYVRIIGVVKRGKAIAMQQYGR